MDERIEALLPTCWLSKAKMITRSARACVWLLPSASNFKAQEVNRRMKDKAAHACHALCRARVLEEIRRRKGTPSVDHLKLVLTAIDGPRFTAKNE